MNHCCSFCRSFAVFGVLVDVSGSMKSALSLDGFHHKGAEVKRTHAILTSTLNIVKREVAHHRRRDSVFVCAFGLNNVNACDILASTLNIAKREFTHQGQDSLFELVSELENTRMNTCDLLSLLELVEELKHDGRTYHDKLIDIAMEHGAPQAKEWIPKHLSEFEARLLHRALMTDKSLIPGLVELIPGEATLGRVKAGGGVAGGAAAALAASMLPFFLPAMAITVPIARYASAKYAQKN